MPQTGGGQICYSYVDRHVTDVCATFLRLISGTGFWAFSHGRSRILS